MKVERNALESARFGVAFARLTDPFTGELAAVVRAADRAGIDVISTRVSTADLPFVREVEDHGFRIMDTLVYHRVALPRSHPPKTAGMTVGAASEEDTQACARIAASAFHDYVGHYHADPRLDAACADAAYVDWTERLLRDPADGQISLCARAGNAVAGFLVGVPRSGGASEIVLNAVDPGQQGQGGYAAMLTAYLGAVESRGDRAVIISTQLQNYRVQRAWHRHGFMLFDSYHTLHRWRPGRAT